MPALTRNRRPHRFIFDRDGEPDYLPDANRLHIVRRGSRGGARVAPTRQRPHAAPFALVGFVLSGAFEGRDLRRGLRGPSREELDVARIHAPPALTALLGVAPSAMLAARRAARLHRGRHATLRSRAAGDTDRDRRRRAAANVGLFGAQDPTYDGVYRQSLAILGLVATGHLPDTPAVDWLLAQQCSDGAFTAYRANTSAACIAIVARTKTRPRSAIQALVALGKPTTTAVAATEALPAGGRRVLRQHRVRPRRIGCELDRPGA